MKVSRIDLRIEPELKKLWTQKAKEMGMTLSQLIVLALRQYIG